MGESVPAFGILSSSSLQLGGVLSPESTPKYDRVAQRESASLTWKKSKVRSLLRLLIGA